MFVCIICLFIVFSSWSGVGERGGETKKGMRANAFNQF